MIVQTPTDAGSSRETATPAYDLDWLKTTTSPTATRTQTARLLGVDERTITRAVTDGSIPSIRVGRRMLVPVPALRRMLGIAEPGQPLTTTPNSEGGAR